MRTTLIIFCLPVLLFVLNSCETPKHLTKKGDKYSNQELYIDACSQYIKALNKKRNFLKAKEGLQFAGNKQIDIYLDNFFKNKSFGKKREAIYLYRKAVLLNQKLKKYSINIDIPQKYTVDYNLLVDEYVETSYNKAVKLLDKEDFTNSESLFKEISKLKPNYKDVNNMKDIATFEPIYRNGNKLLELEKFRAAYYQYDKIPLNYKECNDRKNMALEAGLITIAILKFENATYHYGVESAVSAMVTEELMKLNNPFVKLVDRKLTNTIINEQILGLSGHVAEGTSAQAGKLIGAKAVISGKVVSYTKKYNPIEKTVTKGWLMKRVKKFDSDNKKYYDTTYEKIKYNICQGNSSVDIGFHYQLTSTESGEILYTKLINLNKRDKVHFAESNYNNKNIYPGNWKSQTKKYSSDFISDSRSEKRSLNTLFKSKKNLLSTDQMSNMLYKSIAKKVSNQINNYNPEK